MKNGLIVAASALLGTASAGIHRMKLEKIPLEQQLVSWGESQYSGRLTD
jgi:saccharopepsin